MHQLTGGRVLTAAHTWRQQEGTLGEEPLTFRVTTASADVFHLLLLTLFFQTADFCLQSNREEGNGAQMSEFFSGNPSSPGVHTC